MAENIQAWRGGFAVAFPWAQVLHGGIMSDSAGSVYYDNHMHTPLCRHAVGEPEEYAEVALRRGLKGIVFTCHSPMPDNWWARVRMRPEELDEYVAMVGRAREAYAGRLDIRLGIEADFFPGYEGWIEELCGRCEFHHVLGSVHFFSGEYRERYWRGDVVEFQRGYFRHLADSAETGLFDTLAHPDLVKNHSPEQWDLEAIRPEVEAALDRIAASGVAMELNTSGLHKRVAEFNPGPGMLRMMRERNIPVVLGSDSHEPGRVASHFPEALDALEAVGYREVSWFLERRRQSAAIAAVRASLGVGAPGAVPCSGRD